LSALERAPVRPSLQNHPVCIPTGESLLNGELTLPKDTVGLVVLAQDSDHSRDEVAKRDVAKVFNKYKLATLVADGPSFQEGSVYDIVLQADRLEHVALWVQQNPDTTGLYLGYFATGPGTSAALMAAARKPEMVEAVVSRGGRPDLAMEFLPMVKSAVLLVVAGRDPECLRSNTRALQYLNSDSTLNVIPRASRFFEEPGAMEEAVQLAALWFSEHLG
jgi:dienelactone hydrolase